MPFKEPSSSSWEASRESELKIRRERITEDMNAQSVVFEILVSRKSIGCGEVLAGFNNAADAGQEVGINYRNHPAMDRVSGSSKQYYHLVLDDLEAALDAVVAECGVERDPTPDSILKIRSLVYCMTKMLRQDGIFFHEEDEYVAQKEKKLMNTVDRFYPKELSS